MEMEKSEICNGSDIKYNLRSSVAAKRKIVSNPKCDQKKLKSCTSKLPKTCNGEQSVEMQSECSKQELCNNRDKRSTPACGLTKFFPIFMTKSQVVPLESNVSINSKNKLEVGDSLQSMCSQENIDVNDSMCLGDRLDICEKECLISDVNVTENIDHVTKKESSQSTSSQEKNSRIDFFGLDNKLGPHKKKSFSSGVKSKSAKSVTSIEVVPCNRTNGFKGDHIEEKKERPHLKTEIDLTYFPKVSHYQQLKKQQTSNLGHVAETINEEYFSNSVWEGVIGVIDEESREHLSRKNKIISNMKATQENFNMPVEYEQDLTLCDERNLSGLEIDFMWTEIHKTMDNKEKLNESAVKNLRSWLLSWKQKCPKTENTYNSNCSYTSSDSSDSYSDDIPNAVVLTGLPGSGKTSIVNKLAAGLGFTVLEVNASSCRSGRHIMSQLREAFQSYHVENTVVKDTDKKRTLFYKKETNENVKNKLCVESSITLDVSVTKTQKDNTKRRGTRYKKEKVFREAFQSSHEEKAMTKNTDKECNTNRKKNKNGNVKKKLCVESSTTLDISTTKIKNDSNKRHDAHSKKEESAGKSLCGKPNTLHSFFNNVNEDINTVQKSKDDIRSFFAPQKSEKKNSKRSCVVVKKENDNKVAQKFKRKYTTSVESPNKECESRKKRNCNKKENTLKIKSNQPSIEKAIIQTNNIDNLSHSFISTKENTKIEADSKTPRKVKLDSLISFKKPKTEVESIVSINNEHDIKLVESTEQKISSLTVILFDDVDVVLEEDDGFWNAVNTFLKISKKPVIFTVSRNFKCVMNHLTKGSEVLNMTSPSEKALIKNLQNHFIQIGKMSCIPDLKILAAYHANDVRRCLLQLQFRNKKKNHHHNQTLHNRCETIHSGSKTSLSNSKTSNSTFMNIPLFNSSDDFSIAGIRRSIFSDKPIKFLKAVEEHHLLGYDILYSNIFGLLDNFQSTLPLSCWKNVSESLRHMESNRKSCKQVITESMPANVSQVKEDSECVNSEKLLSPNNENLSSLSSVLDDFSYADVLKGQLGNCAFQWRSTGERVKKWTLGLPMCVDDNQTTFESNGLEVISNICLHAIRKGYHQSKDLPQSEHLISDTASNHIVLDHPFSHLTKAYPCNRELQVERVASVLPVLQRLNKRAINIDYLTTLKNICDMEAKKQTANFKRGGRFLHYFDSISMLLEPEDIRLIQS